MSEQNTNAQLEAYRTLVDDFKRFVSSEIRAEENSYRIVDMTSEDAEIDDPSVPVTQLEDEEACRYLHGPVQCHAVALLQP